jgi:ankyrin repeat protein
MQSRPPLQQEPKFSQLLNVSVLANVASCLTPEEIANLRLVNQGLSAALTENHHWRGQVERHFHAHYKEVKNWQNVDWFSLFKYLYDFHYRDLPARMIKIISLIRSGDISGLDQLNFGYDDLIYYNSFLRYGGRNYLWQVMASTRNQALMDYFFKKLVEPRYNLDDYKKEIFNLFSIAIAFNQAAFFDKHWSEVSNAVGPTFISPIMPFLHNAAKHGHVGLIHSIINAGFNVDSLARINADFNFDSWLIGDKTQTPLELAVNSGRADAVKALFDRGASKENLGRLIHLAAQSGHYRTFKAIEETGVSFYDAFRDRESTLLHSAVRGRNIKIVNAIFKKMKDVQVDAVDKLGQTPLHLAAKYGCVNIFNQLLLSRASILKITNNGDSMLHSAARGGEPAIVSLIIDKNILDINMKNSLGETPLHCVFPGKNKLNHEVIDILIRAGADVNAMKNPLNKGVEGKTPLHYAVSCRSSVGVEKLLRNGANVNAVSKGGKPPIFYLLRNEEDQIKETPENVSFIFNKLVDARADVNIKIKPKNELSGKSCVTVLHRAVSPSCGNLPMVEMLLKAKAEVNAVNEDDQTPLHVAVYCKNTAMVEALLAAGSRIDLVNKSNETPFDLCVKSGNFQHVSAFAQRGDVLNPDVLKNLKNLDFSMVSMSADALAEVLTGAFNLRTLNLEAMEILPSSPNFSLPENVSFPSLTTIHVSFDDDLSVLPVLKAILKASPAVEKVGWVTPGRLLLNIRDDIDNNMGVEVGLAFYKMCQEVFKSHKNPYAGKVLAAFYENGWGICKKKLHDAKAIYDLLGDQVSVDRVQEKINEMWVNGLFATPAEASEKRPSDGCDSPSKRQKK